MLTDSIKIVPAGEKHLAGMISLLSELFSLENDFRPDSVRQENGLRLLMEDEKAVLFTAVYGDEVIGMVSLQVVVSTAEGGFAGLVEDVIVKDEFRRLGIGKKLLSTVEITARKRGLKRLQLLADRKNNRALSFYKACGWTGTDLVNIRKCL